MLLLKAISGLARPCARMSRYALFPELGEVVSTWGIYLFGFFEKFVLKLERNTCSAEPRSHNSFKMRGNGNITGCANSSQNHSPCIHA